MRGVVESTVAKLEKLNALQQTTKVPSVKSAVGRLTNLLSLALAARQLRGGECSRCWVEFLRLFVFDARDKSAIHFKCKLIKSGDMQIDTLTSVECRKPG